MFEEVGGGVGRFYMLQLTQQRAQAARQIYIRCSVYSRGLFAS